MGLDDFTGTPGDPTGAGGAGSLGGFSAGLPTPGTNTDDVAEMLIDYNDRFKDADPAKFRDGIIAQTMAVLIGSTKPNPLLLGPAGTGKSKIAEEIARRIAANDPSVPKQLRKATVYELPLANLVAGAGIVGELEERLVAIVNFLSDRKANDAIVFIDEIHALTPSTGGHTGDPTMQKVARILKPALARGDIRTIGATTLQEGRGFDHDPALKRRFTRLLVDELTREQTVEILMDLRPSLLNHYQQQVLLPDATLQAAAVAADEIFNSSSHRPDGAITLLDRTIATSVVKREQVIANAQATGNQQLVQALQAAGAQVIGEEQIHDVALRLATGLSERPRFDEARTRASLARMRGQEGIVEELVDQMRREHLSIFPRTQPLSWMFAGDTGVGKTEIAKIISAEFTSIEPIRLDMNEYQHESDVTKILGAPPGYVGSDSNQERPFDSLETNPYRVILLDEFEKAHAAVKLLFLSVFDEGRLTMASGKEIDFSKTVIVATTNAARDAMKSMNMGFVVEQVTELSRSRLVTALEEAFPRELLNRFTQLIYFAPIGEETFAKIVEDEYAAELARLQHDHARVAGHLPQTIDAAGVTAQSYVRGLGARPAKKAVRRLIEDLILAGQQAHHAAFQQSSANAVASSDEDEHDGADLVATGADAV